MLIFHHQAADGLKRSVVEGPVVDLMPGTVWIDMLEPTPEEASGIERLLGIDVPTREEMKKIEESSRLYAEDGALFMTMPIVNKAATEPESASVTFILAPTALVTLRYVDPQPFGRFAKRILRQPELAATPEQALIGLLEQVVERLDDILEEATADIDTISADIFRSPAASLRGGTVLHEILKRVGRSGDLASKARGSVLGLSRLLLFLRTHPMCSTDGKSRLETLMQDVQSLADHDSFLTDKVSFLQDATLGMINIEQSAIIKLFTVAAVAFMPPTLVASIYGMNFRHMPELDWTLGYPLAIVLMVLSAVLPFLFFRRKGWL
jgi:magnesium transporter